MRVALDDEGTDEDENADAALSRQRETEAVDAALDLVLFALQRDGKEDGALLEGNLAKDLGTV